MEDPVKVLGAFRICRVIEAQPHPNADRLRLCRVATWPNGPDAPSEEVQVVCGAPNARTGLVGSSPRWAPMSPAPASTSSPA